MLILTIILLFLTLTTLVVSFFLPDDVKGKYIGNDKYAHYNVRRIVRQASVGLLALAVVVGVISSTTIVKPRTVGVEVSFGKTTRVLNNGFHFKAPWASVERLDTAKQNDKYTGNDAISARLGNNGKAQVNATVQWRLKDDDAMNVFLDYRTFESIQSNLVDRNVTAAVNEVMAEYDPLNPKNTAKGGADLSGLADQVKEKISSKVGDQIEVYSVTIPLIEFDESTQSRINDLQAESARTRVAEQKKSTNEAEAKANKALEQSLTNETLTSKCLDIVKETKQSPLGCFPGTGVSPVKDVTK